MNQLFMKESTTFYWRLYMNQLFVKGVEEECEELLAVVLTETFELRVTFRQVVLKDKDENIFKRVKIILIVIYQGH